MLACATEERDSPLAQTPDSALVAPDDAWLREREGYYAALDRVGEPQPTVASAVGGELSAAEVTARADSLLEELSAP